jgi:hypothetical protein
LSEGLDRQHPAVLGVVGINLPRLLAIASPEGSPTVEPSPFLAKLGSLARLALSAGHARREHLRRSARAAVTQGFLLDRARLMIVPFGLDSVVRTVTGQSASAGGSSLEFTCHILQTLYATLQNDPPRHFPACLDAMPPCAAIDERGAFVPDDRDGTPRQQLRAAGVLHTVVEAGTAVVRLPGERSPSPEEVAHLLWYAWQQPGLVRVRFVRQFPARRQLSAGW